MFLTQFIFGGYCVRLHLTDGQMKTRTRCLLFHRLRIQKGALCAPFVSGECGIRTHAPLPANGFQDLYAREKIEENDRS